MPVRSPKRWPLRASIVFCALVLTIGFGFFKQIKVAIRSWPSITAQATEPGHEFIFIKPHLTDAWPRLSSQGRISYQSDFTEELLQSSAIYRFYDAQYALSPYLIQDGKDADYFILDFTTEEALRQYAQNADLEIVAQRDGIAIATKRGLIRK